jgi:hypothetical protein
MTLLFYQEVRRPSKKAGAGEDRHPVNGMKAFIFPRSLQARRPAAVL